MYTESVEHLCLMYEQEILRYSPDIICLQEVDHFKFLGQHMHVVK